MKLEIKLPDKFFENGQREILENLFIIVDESDSDDVKERKLKKALENIICAALSEYREMFLGRGLPSRADEIQQHRLYFLIKYHFKYTIPSEAQVSSIFQLTQSRSRSLIRAVLTRFHYELTDKLDKTLKNTLKKGYLDKDKDYCHVNIHSAYVLDEMNRLIALNAPDLYSVKKVENVARTYKIDQESFQKLQELLEFNESEIGECKCKWEDEDD